MKKGILFFLAICLALILGCGGNGNGDDGKALAAEPAPKTTVHAYDADGQYLGVLLSIDPTEIFIPSLGYAAKIGNHSGAIYFKRDYQGNYFNLSFHSSDCTGDRFTVAANNIMRDGDDRYFVGVDGPYEFLGNCDGDLPKTSYLNYYGECLTPSCPPGSGVNPIYGYEWELWYQAVEVLEVDIPFTQPVALPMSYVYE